MFKKLLNKVEVAVKEQQTLKPITSSEIQEEMHKELRFVLENNQIETIKEEVAQFKESNKHILSKAEKLKTLGFVNTPTIAVENQLKEVTREKEAKVKLETEEINLTNVYALAFPGYKFVPERIFHNVRDKYDLYTASTDRYIKEIPEKNLDEVVNFTSTIKDTHEFGRKWYSIWGSDRKLIRIMSGTEKECLQRMSEYEKMSNDHSYDFSYEVRPRTDLLQITAPIHHFNLKDSEVKGREITDKRPVLDPIVSHKVDGGYIIVSAWDKEAEIPEIQNPINN